MQPIIRFLCVVSLSAPISVALAETPDQQAMTQWYEGIQTGYQLFAEESQALADTAKRYCADPSDQGHEELETAWLDAFLAWQRVRFVDFGPVETDNRVWQFQFWPDPKNLIARKAKNLLKSEEPITAELIDQSGVAVQGFPMLEYLLFDPKVAQGKMALPAPKTCTLFTAVADHAAGNSETLSTDWQAFRSQYLENAQYRDTTIRAGMSGLEILEERRLAQPMGLRGNGKRTPYITDAWRSGNSLRTVEATVSGLRQYFLPGLITLLENTDDKDLADRIDEQFDEVLDNFPAAFVPTTEAMQNDDQFRLLQNLYVDVSQLATQVNDQAAVTLGVVRGFNSSDGD